jgi:hypothetical protein
MHLAQLSAVFEIQLQALPSVLMTFWKEIFFECHAANFTLQSYKRANFYISLCRSDKPLKI